MKIVICTDTFSPQMNGVANVARMSAEVLASLGHEVFVLTVSDAKRYRPEGFTQHLASPVSSAKSTSPLSNGSALRSQGAGFTVIPLPSLPAFIYPGLQFALPLGLAASKILRIRPDIIHTHTPFSLGIEATLAGKLLGIPVVGTHHTFFDHYLGHIRMDTRLGRALSWRYVIWYYNRCKRVLCPSRALGEMMQKRRLRTEVRILPNPIDTDFFRPPSAEEKRQAREHFKLSGPVLVYMGRLSIEKSLALLLDAMAFIAKELSDATLLIVGDGPERERLVAQAERLNLIRIIFTGPLLGEELRRALYAGDVFVTASRSENMPLSVLEAMSTGLPVVAPCALGLPEIVADGESGYLCTAPSPTLLAESIVSLLHDPDKLQRFSTAAHAAASRYSMARFGDTLEAMYRELL